MHTSMTARTATVRIQLTAFRIGGRPAIEETASSSTIAPRKGAPITMDKEPFLILVFPTEKDRAALAALATRFVTELTAACAEPPTMVRPDVTALCMLVCGETARISRALEAAKAPDTRILRVRVDKPVEAFGLSTSYQWIQKHCS